MKNVVQKLWLLKYSFFLVILVSIARVVIDAYNYDIIAISPVITSLVAGVIFAIAVIYSGTLIDYKESEKIPGDMAASIMALYQDSSMIPLVSPEAVQTFKTRIRNLHQIIVHNFESNNWDLEAVRSAGKKIDESISIFARENAAPPILVKMRTECTTIDRISNRIKQIKDTEFILAAYTLAEVSVGLVILILLFCKNESTIEAVLLLASLTIISTGLLFLIRDMDDPFEVGGNSSADVDLAILLELDHSLVD